MVAEDDQADPKVGTTWHRKWGAKLPGCRAPELTPRSPASDIYNRANLTVISGSATNPKLTERASSPIPRGRARRPAGPRSGDYLAATRKPKTGGGH